jgi:hypothetical protein
MESLALFFIGARGSLMIKHMVMWKLKDFSEGADRVRNAKRIKIELEALKNTIPQIWHIEVGINIIKDPSAYDVVLNSVFKSESDFASYKNHPDHRAAASFVSKVIDQRVVVDYETD